MAIENMLVVIGDKKYNATRYIDEKGNVTITFPYQNDQQLLKIIKAYAGRDMVLANETIVIKFY